MAPLFKKKQEQQQRWTHIRLHSILGFALIFAGIIVFRLITLQVFQHDYYVAKADGQHDFTQQLLPKRGEIFFQENGSTDLYPAAINQKLYYLYADPKNVPDDQELTKKLLEILGITDDTEKKKIITNLANKNDRYEAIKHKLTDDQKSQIEALQIKGLHFLSEDFRYYPEGQLASQILGFVGYQNEQRVGQYGIEGYYNEELEGRSGSISAEKDTAGRFIMTGARDVQQAHDGDDLVLTIDRVVQYQVEKRLAQAVKDYQADSGTIIVMNPKTGAIIAMANLPTFDSNNYSQVTDPSVYQNKAIRDLYEPGSVFKAVNMAGALDRGVVDPDTTFVDEGFTKVDKYTIHNAVNRAYGVTTMTQVLERSLNTGMIFVMGKMGTDQAYDNVTKFGFNDLTGIDLDKESENHLKAKDNIHDIDLATMGFGQGIAVTPIQIVTAFAALANDGKLMKPYVVDQTIAADGTRTKTKPEMVRQVISSRSASKIDAMLVSVVERGSAHLAKIDGYHIAAKTGTAQVSSPDKKGYEQNHVITSFAGFAPLENPAFAILVKLDNPKKSEGAQIWGENTAGPVFHDITDFLLKYYQIPPTAK